MNRFRSPRSGDLLASDLTSYEIGVLLGIRDAGSVNMLNRSAVLSVLSQIGSDREHDRLAQLSPTEWGLALVRMSEMNKARPPVEPSQFMGDSTAFGCDT